VNLLVFVSHFVGPGTEVLLMSSMHIEA